MTRNWNELFTKDNQPDIVQLAEYIAIPQWGELCNYIESAYNVQPRMEHSTCSGARVGT